MHLLWFVLGGSWFVANLLWLTVIFCIVAMHFSIRSWCVMICWICSICYGFIDFCECVMIGCDFLICVRHLCWYVRNLLRFVVGL